MKKTLLLSALTLGTLASVAQNKADNYAYPEYDGFKLENVWLYARNYNNWTVENLPFTADWDRTRTAAIAGDKVVLGYSHKIEVNGELNSGSAHIGVMDLNTGKYLKTVQCTLDGNTIDGLLVSNQIGVDEFGNIWFCGFASNLYNENGARELKVYKVDDLDSGACSLAFTVSLPEDEAEAGVARVDYFDLVGDVTGKEAGTVFMTASCENAAAPHIFGWQRDQGSNKWEPHMSDNGYVSQEVEATYPADQLLFNYGSMLTIVRDEEHSGNLFYVDGYTTYPTLYDANGTMLESFADADELKPDDVGANGLAEFTIGGRNFICYPINQYNKGNGWELRICELGEGMTFNGMKHAWTFPEKGQGSLTDQGMRIHNIQTQKITDDAGKEGVMLMQYKTNGGVGVYRMTEPGFNAGATDITADNTQAPVEYFNLQGMRVEQPAAGTVVIRRQGNNVTKETVR